MIDKNIDWSQTADDYRKKWKGRGGQQEVLKKKSVKLKLTIKGVWTMTRTVLHEL